MFWNQYPYINLNDLNLDFLLKAIGEMQNEVENFVSINAIKYANPIQWDITRQYEKNTVVIDPVTGTAYISVAPVPSGVSLARTDYWTVIFDLASFITKANQNLANNYEEQSTTTATMNTNEGDWVVWGDVLYKALVNITAGDAYVVDSNIERITIEDVIKLISTDISTALQSIAILRNDIDAEVLARQNADNTLQNEINDLARGAGYINIKKRGCVGDGVVDNTELLQSLIEEAESTGNSLYVPSGVYKSDTLWVNSNIRIVGNGEIKSSGFLYDNITASVSVGGTSVTVADGSIYHVNNVVRITNGVTNDIMVITEINGNVLTINRFRYFDAYPSTGVGLKNAYSSGSTIIKCPLQLFISYAISATNNEMDFNNDIINNVYIEGITFRGDITTFNSAYLSVYDVTIINGGLVVYMAANVTINKCRFYNRIAQHLIFVGRCHDWKVENCYFTNAIGVGSSAAWNDSASGPCNHWDERTSNSAHVSENFEIANCVIDNCYCGIFESAGKNGFIHDNMISDCQHYGINVYQGDVALGTQLINVHHNTLKNIVNTDGLTEGRAIGINGGDACIIDANDFYTNTVGLFINLSSSLMISNNLCVGNSKASMEIHRTTTSDIVGNRFASGAGTTNNVLINNDTALSASINFSGNVYQGNNSSGNSAIHLVSGAMNIVFINETIRSIRMFKIENEIDTSTASIICINCAQVIDSSNLFAATAAELAKIVLVNCYTAYQNMLRNSDCVNSKTTTALNSITSGVKGATQYDETANTLKVFNGSSWSAT